MDDPQMHTRKVIKAEEGAGSRQNGSTKAKQHKDLLHAQEAGHYFSKHCLSGFEHKDHFQGCFPGPSRFLICDVSSYLKTRLSVLVRWN